VAMVANAPVTLGGENFTRTWGKLPFFLGKRT